MNIPAFSVSWEKPTDPPSPTLHAPQPANLNDTSLKDVWLGKWPLCKSARYLTDRGFGCVKRREYTSNSSGKSGEEKICGGYTQTCERQYLPCCPVCKKVYEEILIRGIGSINSSIAVLKLCDGTEIRDLTAVNIHDECPSRFRKAATCMRCAATMAPPGSHAASCAARGIALKTTFGYSGNATYPGVKPSA